MATTSEIKELGGVPTLFVNGKPRVGLAYVTYLPDRADDRGMYELGCRLFSVCLYFAKRPVNAKEECGPFDDGIFEDPEHDDFSIVDRELERLSEHCPDALIFPRINLNLPAWWDRAHPSELNDHGVKGHLPRPCVASSVWQEAVAERLERLIRFIEESPWADRVIGYQLAGGQTEEWMAVDMNGCRGEALRKAFEKEFPAGTQNDFRAYSGYANVKAIEFFAQKVKKIVGGRKVVGAFYGYTFETPRWQQAHACLCELLEGTGVDFLCSPLSYGHIRASGIDWAPMTVVDTICKHGRMYFAEGDIRTCKTLPLAEVRPDLCKPEHYSGGVWEGPRDPWESRQQLLCAYGRTLTHGNAFWWFDMWGGWYDHPDFREDIRSFLVLAEQSLGDPRRGSCARLAVFMDEKACTRSEHPDPDSVTVAYENRFSLGSCGVPYEVYDISDFEDVFFEKTSDGDFRYQAAVFLIPYETEAMTGACTLWAKENRPFLIADRKKPLLSSREIRELCRGAGIHCWAQAGDVLYANENWVVLHAATAGEKTVYLPEKRKITPIFTDHGEPSLLGDRITLSMKQYETRLYRLDPCKE